MVTERETFPSGGVFEGLFKNGLAHGYGTHVYQSNDEIDRYSGLWASGKKEGFGTLIYSDSSRMEGHWKSGELHYGEYQGSDGVILTGKWNQSSLSEGKMKTEFNEEFTGSFNPDGSFAKGTFLSSDGDRYTGHFQANSYHGSGVLEQKDGSLSSVVLRRDFCGGGGLGKTEWIHLLGNFQKWFARWVWHSARLNRSYLFGDVGGRNETRER